MRQKFSKILTWRWYDRNLIFSGPEYKPWTFMFTKFRNYASTDSSSMTHTKFWSLYVWCRIKIVHFEFWIFQKVLYLPLNTALNVCWISDFHKELRSRQTTLCFWLAWESGFSSRLISRANLNGCFVDERIASHPKNLRMSFFQ